MKLTLPRTLLLFVSFMCCGLPAHASEKPFEPVSGQAGKDVVWVPTPPSLVEKMLDVAKVTPQDFVMDLGSGDGRNIIAAAKRGARAVGVEYNPEMVEYSTRAAEKAGVAGMAKFVEGDMFAADISQATVLALFLLPDNLDKLVDKFLDLKPGTRIVLNTFGIRNWEPDETFRGEDCGAWCDVLLYYVPARVAGDWSFMDGKLHFDQSYQVVTGTYESTQGKAAVSDAKLRGDRISFNVNGTSYDGIVEGNTIRPAAGASWSAQRAAAQ